MCSVTKNLTEAQTKGPQLRSLSTQETEETTQASELPSVLQVLKQLRGALR